MAATVVLTAEVALMTEPVQVLGFLPATAASFWLHMAWREDLARRFGSVDPRKEVT